MRWDEVDAATVQRLLTNGWRFGWRSPSDTEPLLDTDQALERQAQIDEQIELDRLGQAALIDAARGDSYLKPLTVPDAPPPGW